MSKPTHLCFNFTQEGQFLNLILKSQKKQSFKILNYVSTLFFKGIKSLPQANIF